MSPTWSANTDWDAAQSETGVHHEQPTGSDYAAASTLEKGPPPNLLNTKSVVASWFCHEDSGSTINDVTGNGYDLSASGGPAFNVSGPLGFSAVSFDGTDSVAKSSTTAALTDVTMGAMIKTTNASNFGGIVANDTNTNPFAQLVTHDSGVSSGYGIRCQVEDSAGDRTDKSGSIQIDDGNWHLVGFTWDDSVDDMFLYTDGSEDTNTTTEQAQGTSSLSIDEPFQLGLTRDDFEYLDADIAYAFVDDAEWTASDWSDLWQSFV